MLATQTPGGSTEDELTEMLVDRGVSGIIFVSGLHADTTADMTRYDRLRGQGVPFVLIDGFTDQVRAPFISPTTGRRCGWPSPTSPHWATPGSGWPSAPSASSR